MKKSMKRLFAVLFTLMAATIYVQAQEEITDEDLYRYALMQQVIEEMKSEISTEVNNMIKQQEGIDGNRYVELSKAGGDEAKLKEMGAKDFEIQFINLVEEEKEERIEAIKEVNKLLATKMLGDRGKKYKSIKSALSSDDAVKSRYKTIEAGIAMEAGE